MFGGGCAVRQNFNVVPIDLTLHALASTNTTLVRLGDTQPTLYREWTSLIIYPRDVDGFAISSDLRDSNQRLELEVFTSIAGERISAECSVSWMGTDYYATSCNMPNRNEAGWWNVTVSLTEGTNPAETIFSESVLTWCPADMYMDTTSAMCVDCTTKEQEGVHCPYPGLVTETLTVEPGWWRAYESSTDVLECVKVSASGCRGGNYTVCSDEGQIYCALDSINKENGAPPCTCAEEEYRSNDGVMALTKNDAYCAVGYTGPLCSVCAPSYFWKDSFCNDCSEVGGKLWSYYFMFFFVLLAAYVVYHIAKEEWVAAADKKAAEEAGDNWETTPKKITKLDKLKKCFGLKQNDEKHEKHKSTAALLFAAGKENQLKGKMLFITYQVRTG